MLSRRLPELVTSIEAAFVRRLSSGLVLVAWQKTTFAITICYSPEIQTSSGATPNGAVYIRSCSRNSVKNGGPDTFATWVLGPAQSRAHWSQAVKKMSFPSLLNQLLFVELSLGASLCVYRAAVPSKLPEQVFLDATPRPAHKTIIDRCWRTILGWGNRTSDSRFSAHVRCR